MTRRGFLGLLAAAPALPKILTSLPAPKSRNQILTLAEMQARYFQPLALAQANSMDRNFRLYLNYTSTQGLKIGDTIQIRRPIRFTSRTYV